MKWLLITIIHIYQKIPFQSHKQCRMIPTCSKYMEEAIKEYGSIIGLYLGIKRIIKCNPLQKNIVDPVPKRRKK